ncbi:MAG: hypothetical protein DHS20C15_22850 [Planctomycetota bacterium]|nr:MAG: hypothetical protein DHS20C15_22850 [Planctomycetota bacterium]
MSTTVRTWLAALALGFSALVLLLGADGSSLSQSAPTALLLVCFQGWMIAVAERNGPKKGGLEFPRFSLGPRLGHGRPSLFPQCALMALSLGWLTGNGTWLALAGVALLIGFADLVRAALPLLLPVAGIIAGLLTMDEFHSLGDLLTTAQSWIQSALLLAVGALVVCGPLLRTDAAGPLSRRGKALVLIAGLPGYLGAVWFACFSPWAGAQPDLMNLVLVLLLGGLVQTLVMGLGMKPAGLSERRASELPRVTAAHVGLAMLPLLLPLLAMGTARWVEPAGALSGQVPREAWIALMGVLVVVPAVLAAGMVAARLDRLDRTHRSRVPEFVTLGLFGVWFVLGPQLMHGAFGPAGWGLQLKSQFPVLGAEGALIAEVGASSALPLGLPMEGLAIWGLPAADLARALTLLVAACALLSTRLLRHARVDCLGPGVAPLLLLFGFGLGVGALASTMIGPVGLLLGPLVSTCGVLVLDTLRGPRPRPAEAVTEFESSFVGEMDAPLDAREVSAIDDDGNGDSLALDDAAFEGSEALFEDGWEPAQRFGEVDDTEADARAAEAQDVDDEEEELGIKL